jgi:hypothetical protein
MHLCFLERMNAMAQRTMVWLGILGMLNCMVLAGCGGGDAGAPVAGVTATGKLLDGGQPAKLADYQDGYVYYEVSFVPTAGGAGMSNSVAEDGSFDITGIEAGSYKVGVAKIVTGDEAADEWQGKHSADKSPVTVQVEEGKEITVDLKEVMGSGGAAPATE